MTPRSVAELLARVPVFSRSPGFVRQQLARDAKLRHLRAGERIGTSGDAATHVHAIVAGTVRIFHEADGQQVTVKQLEAPVTLSEKEVVAGLALVECSAAMTPVDLISISADRYLDFLGPADTPARLALKDLCLRFCVAIRNERALVSPLPTRLASFILSLVEMFGENTTQGAKVRLPVTQRDLADGVGGGLRSVNRILSEWSKLGWLARRQGWLIVSDQARLEELAGDLRFNLNFSYRRSLGLVGEPSARRG